MYRRVVSLTETLRHIESVSGYSCSSADKIVPRQTEEARNKSVHNTEYQENNNKTCSPDLLSIQAVSEVEPHEHPWYSHK